MNLPALLALVDGYHITDKRLLRARSSLERDRSEANERTFRAQVARYFTTLVREAQAHIADVDRRLDDVYQRQYNLSAERAVAQRRLQGARQILQALEND
jgi:hypothetical protein